MRRPVHSRLSTLATTTALATCALVLVPVSSATAAPPTATVVVADSPLSIGETPVVTITFSEAVTGFTNADLTIENGTLSAVSSGDGGVTWTATFTPTASITDPTNVITLNNAGVQNGGAEAGVGTTDSNNYAIDTLRPTATVAVADNALSAGETSLVTVTFSEAVTGFSNADLTISNGTLSAVFSGDGGVTWTATFTPTASITDSTNVITLGNTGVSDQAGNTGAGTTDSNNYAIDTQRPTAGIVLTDSALSPGETTTVTTTFNEAVTGLSLGDFTPENGTLSNLSTADGGVTWTMTFTQTPGPDDATNVITLDNTGVVDAAGNAGTGTTTSNNYVIDSGAPTGTIALADSALKSGDTSLVTITFSEPVAGFTNADLTVPNGTLSNVATGDGGTTWTATFTPSAATTDDTNKIALTNAGVTDVAGNAVTGTVESANFTIDTATPAATIVLADNALAIGQTSLVTFSFGEPVTGFTNADVTAPNGTLSTLASSNGGATYTATFTPIVNTNDATNVITVANNGVTDAATNVGVGTSTSNNFTIDSTRPTASIAVANTSLSIGETSTVTITFSEPVTGFTNSDLSVPNGTLSAVFSGNGGQTWTATFTPTANITDTTNVVTLNNASVTDVAGNAGTGSTTSNSYAVDTARPTVTIVVADNAVGIGQTSLVTITFSEAVSGFSNADLSVANGTLSNVATTNGGVTWTATFTPTAAVTDTTNLITIDNTGVLDAAGNAGTGTSTSNNYAVDATRPTASIVVVDSTLLVGETSPVTVTFSEPVAGFTNADLVVANGTLSTVATSDGGKTWTATLTPAASVVDSTNVITLANTGVTDVAGNAGTGTSTSNNYAVDTTPLADSAAPSSASSGPAQTRSRTFRVDYVAADAASEVASVALFARAPGGAGFVKVATDSTTQDGRFAFTGTADGTYAFYTVATDAAGNVEASPISPDHTTRLDTRGPSLGAAMGAGVLRFDLSSDRVFKLRFRVDEPVRYTFKVMRNGVTVRTFGQRRSSRSFIAQNWDGRNNAGRFVAAGRYKIVVVATDAVGNRATASKGVVVTR